MSRISTCGGISHRAYESATEKRALLAVIGMLHDKDIAGTLAWLKAWLMTGIVRHWKGRAVPRQTTA